MAVDPRFEAPEKTVLDQLCDAILEALLDTPFYKEGAGDPAVKLFDFVEYGVLDDIEPRTTPAARIELGESASDTQMSWLVDKTQRMYVHFKIAHTKGVDPTTLINYYFGRIVNVLVIPEHFADIATDIAEVGNSQQSQGINDPEPGGTIWFDIQYRHALGDPFKEDGNVT